MLQPSSEVAPTPWAQDPLPLYHLYLRADLARRRATNRITRHLAISGYNHENRIRIVAIEMNNIDKSKMKPVLS